MGSTLVFSLAFNVYLVFCSVLIYELHLCKFILSMMMTDDGGDDDDDNDKVVEYEKFAIVMVRPIRNDDLTHIMIAAVVADLLTTLTLSDL